MHIFHKYKSETYEPYAGNPFMKESPWRFWTREACTVCGKVKK